MSKLCDYVLRSRKACIVMEYKEVRKSYLALVLFFPGRRYEVLFKLLVEKDFYVFEMRFLRSPMMKLSY